VSTTHHLIVNGESHDVTVDYDDTPLLYVLRDNLGLKGVRFGCGNGDCGSCTVLVDGRALKSCEVAVWSVAGKSILTVEGIGRHDRLHPIPQAILALQAGQCGYCLSGIIMSAVAMIQNDPGPPDRDKITRTLSSNLCRCGAHGRIIRAIEKAWRECAAGAKQ
jgi:nicotinate dehydrogenase subunit A